MICRACSSAALAIQRRLQFGRAHKRCRSLFASACSAVAADVLASDILAANATVRRRSATGAWRFRRRRRQ